MNILAFHRQQKVVKCDTIAADGTQLGCGTQHGTCLRYELMIFTILASTMLLRLMRTFSAVLAGDLPPPPPFCFTHDDLPSLKIYLLMNDKLMKYCQVPLSE